MNMQTLMLHQRVLNDDFFPPRNRSKWLTYEIYSAPAFLSQSRQIIGFTAFLHWDDRPFHLMPKVGSDLTLSRCININFSKSEARAWLMITVCIGLKINSAQPETILNLSFKFKQDTSKNRVSLIVGGTFNALTLPVSLEGRKIPFHAQVEKNEGNVFVLSFIHSLRAKEWIIRLAIRTEGTEHTLPSPFPQIQTRSPSLVLHVASTCGQNLLCQAQACSLVNHFNLQGKQLGPLIIASPLSHVSHPFFTPKADIHLSYPTVYLV